MKPVLSIALLCVLLTGMCAAQASPCADAESIFRNAKIVTMSDVRPTAQAMAVRDGKILAIGSESAVAPCASTRTKTVDLQGQTVIPGLIDVHTHASTWATTILRNEIDATYPNVKSIADVVELVRNRVASSKPGEWIIGSGWDDAKFAEHRYITRQDLDAVSPNNPIHLVHVSGHLSVANTAALKAADISDSSTSPEGGELQRASSGHLTGILKDTAMGAISKVLPHDPPDMAERAAKLVSERALAVGLTTIHDIYLSADQMRGYQEAYQRGWLKLRVLMSPQLGSIADAEKLAGMGVHSGFGDDHLKFGAAKMFADGGMGARTVAIYPPGVIGEPDNVGLLRWKPEAMQKAHMIAARAGWQLTTHAIGDRAIDEVLDSYAAVQKELGLKDPRFRIVHAGISTPAVQKRMKQIGIVVDGNPPFVYWIGSWFTKYGPERIRWSYPAKSYIDNGITEAAGSDCNVTPISPWWGIWSAVERKEMQTGEVLVPEERINVMQALKLYTVNGAYAGFEEKLKGSLEPGKLADFLVLDRDVTSVVSDQLKDTVVKQTYVGGELVFEKGKQL